MEHDASLSSRWRPTALRQCSPERRRERPGSPRATGLPLGSAQTTRQVLPTRIAWSKRRSTIAPPAPALRTLVPDQMRVDRATERLTIVGDRSNHPNHPTNIGTNRRRLKLQPQRAARRRSTAHTQSTPRGARERPYDVQVNTVHDLICSPRWWARTVDRAEVLRVLRPGGMLAGTGRSLRFRARRPLAGQSDAGKERACRTLQPGSLPS
jgi:hypothetical protein